MATTNSRVGLKGVCFWEQTADTSASVTYGSKRSEVIEAINATIAPANTDPDIQYAEDVESDVLYSDPELTVTLEAKEIPITLRAWLLGHTVDSNGVMIEKATDAPPYIAMGFKSIKRNNAYRYVQLLKGRAKLMSDTYRTMEKTPTRQTDSIEIVFIKRTYDNDYKYQVDSDTAAFSGEAATFFDAPYVKAVEPYISLTAQPANAAVTVGSVSGTLAVTVSAVPSGSPTYQWYKPTTPVVGTADTAVAGATTASLTIPTTLTAGTHYFYCKIMLTGANTVYSYVAQVIASE
jgi:phi13 family phage major tail protein